MTDPQKPEKPETPGQTPEPETASRPDLFAPRPDRSKTAPRLEDTVRILSTVKPTPAQASAANSRKVWISAGLLACVVAAVAWFSATRPAGSTASDTVVATTPAQQATPTDPAQAAASLPVAASGAASDAAGDAVFAAAQAASGSVGAASVGTSASTTAGESVVALAAPAVTATAAARAAQPSVNETLGAARSHGAAQTENIDNRPLSHSAPRHAAGHRKASDQAGSKAAAGKTTARVAGRTDTKVASKTASRSAGKTGSKTSTKPSTRPSDKSTRLAKAKREEAARTARAKQAEPTRLAAAPSAGGRAGSEPLPRDGELDASVIEALLPYVKRSAAANSSRSPSPAAATTSASSRLATSGSADDECARLSGAAAVSCRAHLCAGRRGQDPSCPVLPLGPR